MLSQNCWAVNLPEDEDEDSVWCDKKALVSELGDVI